MKEELERKLKRERVETCLNCKKFVNCNDIGRFQECIDYFEVGSEKMVVIIGLSEYCRLKEMRAKQ